MVREVEFEGSRQVIMEFIRRTASETAVAWKPISDIPVIRSSTVKGVLVCLLKSRPWISFASVGTGAEGLRTASLAAFGMCVF